MSDPDTIDWYDALNRIIESGHTIDAAPRMLAEAVNSGAVGYYPRRALSFDRDRIVRLADRRLAHARGRRPPLLHSANSIRFSALVVETNVPFEGRQRNESYRLSGGKVESGS